MNSYSWVKSLLFSLFLLIPSDCCYALSRYTYLMNQQNEKNIFLKQSLMVVSVSALFLGLVCFVLILKNRKLQNQPVVVDEEDSGLDETVDAEDKKSLSMKIETLQSENDELKLQYQAGEALREEAEKKNSMEFNGLLGVLNIDDFYGTNTLALIEHIRRNESAVSGDDEEKSNENSYSLNNDVNSINNGRVSSWDSYESSYKSSNDKVCNSCYDKCYCF